MISSTLEPRPIPRLSWPPTDAAGGVALAVFLLLLVPTLRLPTPWSSLAGLLMVWVPLLGCVLIATYVHGSGSLVRDFGLRFTGMDVLVGLFVGLALRSVVFALELLAFGHIATAPVTLGPIVHDGWWLFGAILAPVLIAPVVVELFFRGLLQRSIPTHLPFAIFASATVFALVHLLGGYSWFAAATTFIVGITVGILAGRSNRLGSAIVAHFAFNGSLVVVVVLG